MFTILFALVAFQNPRDEEPPKKITAWVDRLIAGRNKRMEALAADVDRMLSSRTVKASGEVIDQSDAIKECRKQFAELKAGALPLDLFSMPFQPVQYDIGYVGTVSVVDIIDGRTFLTEFVVYEPQYAAYLNSVRRVGERVHKSRALIRGLDTGALLDGRETTLNRVFEATDSADYLGKRIIVLEPFDVDPWYQYIESRSGKKSSPKKTPAQQHKPEISASEAAANKLRLAKAIRNANPSAFRIRLQEIVEKFSDTEAGKEAAELLAK